MVRRISLIAAFLLLLVVGVAAADPPSPDNPAGHGSDILGVVPSQAASHTGGSGGNLAYHGGKVLLTNKTVAIYWSPSRALSSTSPYATLINQYFTDVAYASQHSGNNVYSVETQYYNGSGQHIAYNSTFTGAVYDTDPYPSSGCTDTVAQTTICLSDAQLRTELQVLYSNKAISADADTTYFIFTDKNVGSCYDPTTCAFSYYCAYHSNVTLGNNTVVQYANQPYADTSPADCDSGYHPNNNDADATINVASHEHRESINDPLGNAWYDRRGSEGSDKCAWNFGTVTNGSNQTINGHPYILQQEWSNAASGCRLSG